MGAERPVKSTNNQLNQDGLRIPLDLKPPCRNGLYGEPDANHLLVSRHCGLIPFLRVLVVEEFSTLKVNYQTTEWFFPNGH